MLKPVIGQCTGVVPEKVKIDVANLTFIKIYIIFDVIYIKVAYRIDSRIWCKKQFMVLGRNIIYLLDVKNILWIAYIFAEIKVFECIILFLQNFSSLTLLILNKNQELYSEEIKQFQVLQFLFILFICTFWTWQCTPKCVNT